MSAVDTFPLGASTTLAELADDPHPRLALLRAHEPVSWLPELDGWLVTRRDLALSVMRDGTTFTVDDPRFSTAQVVGPSMLSLDGADHTRHRDPFAAPFRPRAVRDGFAAFIEEETDRLISALQPAGAGELRRAFAGPLAVAVVTQALGLAGTTTETVLTWYDAIVRAVSDITAGLDPGTSGAQAYAQLRGAVEATVADPDTSSLLAAAAGRLTVPEVASNAAVLMFGGIETTEAMITNALLHLLGDPGQLALVKDDFDLLDGAIEESLRLEPGAAVVDRYATRDTVLGPATVRRGDLVTVSLAGANRDPAVFPDPDRFDVRRPEARLQLAFAHGPHHCLAAHLARLETRIALQRLLERLPALRLDPDRPASPHGLVFRKPPTLHVLWS
ncbi:cytochrome P450 [Streptomyces griseorubiginosus]|uniref:cytochrome P450 n=1 Tax=Streptomyces griseorubiginosus TaxID=67304 RepID=UPI001AD6F566|nr:cytochrome P450 [Streptomyces griseorubiginosus]MBO4255200.1 cytochrome P450 [Streptomyces griseorubiginosus]